MMMSNDMTMQNGLPQHHRNGNKNEYILYILIPCLGQSLETKKCTPRLTIHSTCTVSLGFDIDFHVR